MLMNQKVGPQAYSALLSMVIDLPVQRIYTFNLESFLRYLTFLLTQSQMGWRCNKFMKRIEWWVPIVFTGWWQKKTRSHKHAWKIALFLIETSLNRGIVGGGTLYTILYTFVTLKRDINISVMYSKFSN